MNIALATLVTIFVCAVWAVIVMEGYQMQSNDAALVCYWAPQPPPGAVPTRPDPRGSLASEGPDFSDIKIPFVTTSPMVQERSRKTELMMTGVATMPPAVSIDKKAFVETTLAPQEILGSLPVPPTPPPLAPQPTIAPSSINLSDVSSPPPVATPAPFV